MELQAKEPQWLGNIPAPEGDADQRPFLLPGVRVQFAPIGPKAFRAGATASRTVLVAERDEGAEVDVEEASDELARAMIRRGIVAWEGITANGKPVAPDTATIEAFIADARFFLPAQAVYVTPFLLRDAEGKGSAGSPAGTGTRATPARDTATGASPKKRSGSKESGARNARTSSTSPRRKRAKPSGR